MLGPLTLERTYYHCDACQAGAGELLQALAGVAVRKSEVKGRRGKQPDGAAKTREVKLVTAVLRV